MTTGVAWRLPSFSAPAAPAADDPPPPTGAELLEAARQQAEAILAAARADAARLAADAQAEGLRAGTEQGRREGAAAAHREVLAEEGRLARELADGCARFAAFNAALDAALAQRLWHAVQTILDTVLQRTLESPAWLHAMLQRLVDDIRDDLEPVRVILHPDDLARLAVGELPTAVRVHADPAATPGSLRLETPDRLLRFDPATALAALRTELADAAPAPAGTPTPAAAAPAAAAPPGGAVT